MNRQSMGLSRMDINAMKEESERILLLIKFIISIDLVENHLPIW